MVVFACSATIVDMSVRLERRMYHYDGDYQLTPKETEMSDRTSQTIEERVVALLKANRRDLRAFVRAVEALAPPDGDVAGFPG